ncbi:MAG: hypothetical protein EDS66_07665 [Planctomycetota bacterium]|nr:MAG: hypothetical protein EDS66_07665 [Planctomycetota bacterium]MCQ3921524.1 hypothetical protein [Planctomycetota bacterium]
MQQASETDADDPVGAVGAAVGHLIVDEEPDDVADPLLNGVFDADLHAGRPGDVISLFIAVLVEEGQRVRADLRLQVVGGDAVDDLVFDQGNALVRVADVEQPEIA